MSAVVAAWDRPNGTTVMVRADGSVSVVVIDGDAYGPRIVHNAPTTTRRRTDALEAPVAD